MPTNLGFKISNVLHSCFYHHLKQVHALIITKSLTQNLLIVSEFLRRTTEFGSMDYSFLIFSQIGYNDYSSSAIMLWNVMIRGYAHNGPFEKCLYLFDEMPQRGLQPNSYTYPYVLNSCRKMGLCRIGESVHCQVIKSGFGSSFAVADSLFNMYIHMPQAYKLDATRKIFDDACIRSAEMWNKMIFLYVTVSDMESARQLFDTMPQRDVVSWNSMISGYSRIGKVAKARECFDRMPKKNVISWTAMIMAHAQVAELDKARELFDKMPTRNVISWNTMITCYTKEQKYEAALNLFMQMQSECVDPDGYTYVLVLSASSHLGALDSGKWIHYLIRDGSQCEIKVWTALVEMYAQCGDINRAFTIFIKVGNKDVFCWNVAIKVLAIHGRAKDAVKIFLMMQKTALKPNDFTFSSVLFACSHGGLLEEGRGIFYNMEREFGIRPKPVHFCCFIDLLSRNGRIEEAEAFVRNMPFEPDIAIWGALIGGYRVRSEMMLDHKLIEKASELEVNNSGIHVLLSNVYASVNQWPEAVCLRGKMDAKGIWKKPGHSSVL